VNGQARPRKCNHCGAVADVRLFAGGYRCPQHTPARIADVPEPGAGVYCPPRICWCGQCPWAADVVAAPPSRTAIDTRHELSGKRFTTPREQQAARLNQKATNPSMSQALAGPGK